MYTTQVPRFEFVEIDLGDDMVEVEVVEVRLVVVHGHFVLEVDVYKLFIGRVEPEARWDAMAGVTTI